ncbi:luc7-like protein 3 isoform X2 [Diorhabda carinulata]|uniref:luc7-like protein 3 isoform X2 n=1 Tax=Diorhabda carinulata TaxID=1163345 RepID=UPI0025A1318C|nr:luc7-like protein 3 isoform X2 [Diorhabda carinulata]
MTIRDTTFLTEVMDTIASFKDSKGSPPDKILDRIISQRKTPLKNPSLRVKKALKNGLESGLLKEINGKFKLGLGSKDYAIFKNFRTLGGRDLPFKEFRRRGRRRPSRRRRRSKRRRRSEFFDVDDIVLNPETHEGSPFLKLTTSSILPIKEIRGRGRRSRSRRRRSRRRGRRRSDALIDSEITAELMDRSRRRRRKARRRKRRGRRRALDDREESARSSDSGKISKASSEEKPKSAKSGNGDRNTLEKRDIEPEGNRINENVSGHCIHGFHHDDGHYGHSPHFEREYYD